MHEFSVATYLLEAVESKAHELGARHVLTINLVIGDRACIMDDSLNFCFGMLAENSCSDGATLNIRRVPMEFYCEGCAKRYQPKGQSFGCPVQTAATSVNWWTMEVNSKSKASRLREDSPHECRTCPHHQAYFDWQ